MISHLCSLRLFRALVLGIGVLSCLLAVPAMAQQEGGQTLNFRDADIRAFIEDISRVTGKSFIIDPRVQGTVTLISRDPVGAEDMLDILFSTLRANGFSAVPTATGAYRVIPIDQAAQDGTRIGAAGQMGDGFVTEVFRLRNIDSVGASNLVRPMVHPQGQVMANRGSPNLIVVDFASNMERIRQALQSVDRDTSEIRVVSLSNTAPSEMARIVTELARIPGEDMTLTSVLAVPVEGSNTLVLKGDSLSVDRMVATVSDLDARNRLSSDIRVYYLKYAVAREMLPLLEQVTQSLSQSGAAAAGGEAAPPGMRRASIAVDNATNSLVVSAGPEMQLAIEAVIGQLDIRRAQVLVEAIIVEVSDTAARELGLQYVLAGTERSGLPFSVANYSDTAPNILAATGALVAGDRLGTDSEITRELQRAAIQSLFNMSGFALGGGGIASDGTLFGVILTALDEDDESNILSTPSLMTMDNATASIIVGSEIPITTGETLGSDNSNPFRTVERKSVGVQLNVQPQISEGDTIKLFITQEVSGVQGVVSPPVPELITSTKRIETTVSVDDGEILVLGGLIENDEQITVDKIPLLGDLPVLGAAFRSTARSNRRTNLMVFIRTTIVRNAEDAAAVTNRKYDYMRNEQLLRGAAVPSIDVIQRDVLGAALSSLPPEAPAAVTMAPVGE